MISNYSYRNKAARKKSASELIKYVSIETYNRIGFVHRYSIDPFFLLKIGEITLTENLIYELHKFSLEKKVNLVRMFEAKNERKNGADILLDLPVAGGYIRIPLQAKKLYVNTTGDDGVYPHFHHSNKTNGKQSDLLRAYAAKLGSYLPLYLLYNFTKGSSNIGHREKEYYYGCSYMNINDFLQVSHSSDVFFSELHPSAAKPFYRLFEYLTGKGGGGKNTTPPSGSSKKELREFYEFFGGDTNDAFLETVRLYSRDEVFADDENWKDVLTQEPGAQNNEFQEFEGFNPGYRIVLLSEPEILNSIRDIALSDGGDENILDDDTPEKVLPVLEAIEEAIDEEHFITNTI